MRKIFTLITLMLGVYCAQAQTNAGMSAASRFGEPVMSIDGIKPQVKTKADASSFAGGSGTEADPYLIATKEHLHTLDAMATDATGEWPQVLKGVYFKQIADITFEEGDDMPLIGTGAWFAGTYDGDGYAIRNFTLKQTRIFDDGESHNVGSALFVNLKGATLKNIRMVGVNMDFEAEATIMYMDIAGLAANFQESQMINCTAEGTYSIRVIGEGSVCYVGGLVASAYKSTIDNCRSYGNLSSEIVSIDGDSYASVAGIVVDMEDSKVINCISHCNSESYGNGDATELVVRAAGIAAWSKNCQILNSCSRGELLSAKAENELEDGFSYVQTAGIVSVMTGNTVADNCWNLSELACEGYNAQVSGTHQVGFIFDNSVHRNCYYWSRDLDTKSGEDNTCYGYGEKTLKEQFFVDELNKNLPEGGLAWKLRKDDFPAFTDLHTVTLPALTGATTTPGEGAAQIEEGERFRFSLALEEEYDQSKPVVTVGDKTLEPDANMNYVTEPVTADMVVKIDGIVKNTETANEEINASVQKVYVADGILYIQPEATAQVNVFNMQGQLVKSALVSSETQIQLPQGLYIVRLNDQSYKVRISE